MDVRCKQQLTRYGYGRRGLSKPVWGRELDVGGCGVEDRGVLRSHACARVDASWLRRVTQHLTALT
eukprot:2316854-Rhodomonas_salina.1